MKQTLLMADKINPILFDSRFIIDGSEMSLTPAQLLDSESKAYDSTPIVDETLDPAICPYDFNDALVSEYLCKVSGVKCVPVQFPLAGEYSRFVLCESLVDTIWRSGHFKLEDLSLSLRWRWKDAGLGSMAAFYESVRQAAEFADVLDVKIGSFSCVEGAPSLEASTSVRSTRRIPEVFAPDPESWIIYVPFSTGPYRLGASALAHALSLEGGAAPELDDPDYMIDCYELCRELVEDGIALSGKTVGRGGLMCALDAIRPASCGVDADISDIMRAYDTESMAEVLFGETPGVVFQIEDDDFDYIDAEFILQDVMYFPLGHPVPSGNAVRLRSSSQGALGSILSSLVR